MEVKCMENFLYLLNITISGIKNIQKPVTLNFYKDTITSKFNPEDYRIKAIYGENGTGKTALLTGIKILKNLILQKEYITKNENLLMELTNIVTNKIFL